MEAPAKKIRSPAPGDSEVVYVGTKAGSPTPGDSEVVYVGTKARNHGIVVVDHEDHGASGCEVLDAGNVSDDIDHCLDSSDEESVDGEQVLNVLYVKLYPKYMKQLALQELERVERIEVDKSKMPGSTPLDELLAKAMFTTYDEIGNFVKSTIVDIFSGENMGCMKMHTEKSTLEFLDGMRRSIRKHGRHRWEQRAVNRLHKQFSLPTRVGDYPIPAEWSDLSDIEVARVILKAIYRGWL